MYYKQNIKHREYLIVYVNNKNAYHETMEPVICERWQGQDNESEVLEVGGERPMAPFKSWGGKKKEEKQLAGRL